MTEIPDSYRLLGLTVDASPEVIAARRSELVKIHHPDKQGGDRTSFEKIIEAAKDAIRIAHALPCLMCKGGGQVFVGRGFHRVAFPCGACAGKGKRFFEK